MIVLNVFLNVAPSHKESLLNVLSTMAERTRQETGNDYYDYFSRDNQFIIVEYWQDQAALDLHTQSEHLNDFVSRVLPFLDAPLQIEKYTTH